MSNHHHDPDGPDDRRPGEESSGDDEVTALFARALGADAGTWVDADLDAATAFRDLIDLAYAGESRAELAYRAILDVAVERAEADGTMPTPARFDAIIDQAWIAAPTRGRDASPFGSGPLVVGEDGALRFEDGPEDDTAGPDAA